MRTPKSLQAEIAEKFQNELRAGRLRVFRMASNFIGSGPSEKTMALLNRYRLKDGGAKDEKEVRHAPAL